MKVFSIWAEWDLGINSNLYTSSEKAAKDLDSALQTYADMTLEEALAECLAGIDVTEVIE